jgi:hypothetical protein
LIAAVDVRPAEARAFRVTANLGGVSVALRFRWLPRLSRWALVMETPAGDSLTPQLIVQSGGFVPFDSTHADAPGGRLLWVGPETYRREDLGKSLRLVYDDGSTS